MDKKQQFRTEFLTLCDLYEIDASEMGNEFLNKVADIAIPLEAEVKPDCEHNCKTCVSFEIYDGDDMKNWCSQWCVYITDLHHWDIEKNYCDKYASKSV